MKNLEVEVAIKHPDLPNRASHIRMSDASLVDWRKEVRDAAETVITFVEKALGK